jgi:hypothetical protein
MKWLGRESEYMREWYLQHRDTESFRAYKRNFARQARKKNGWIQLESERRKKKYRDDPKQREKELARSAVWRARRDGKLTRPTKCSVCGKVPKKAIDGRSLLQAHHKNYSKPLEVEWQCAPCHNKLERRKI